MSAKTKALIAVLLVSVFCIGLAGGYFGAYFISNKDISSDSDMASDEEGKTVKEQDSKKEIDFTDIVTDAFCKTVPHEYGDYSYRIPQLNYDGNGVDEFNKKMYDELYALYTDSEAASVNLGGEPQLGDISYTWYHTDELISVVAFTSDNQYYNPQFYVYTYSFSDEKELTKSDIITLEGYTEESFNQKVRENVQKVTDNVLENNSGVAGESVFREAIDMTLDEEHINKAAPFYNNNGELCCISDIFSLGGAGMYRHIINLETGTDACDFECGNKF